MAQLVKKTPNELANAIIKPEKSFAMRTSAPYNDEIDITQKVNKIGKPTQVTINHPPVGSYKGYKSVTTRLPSKWQRFKNPFEQSNSLLSEQDVRNKAIERWKKLPESVRQQAAYEYGRELDPFDFEEENYGTTSLQDDIDYLNSEYFTPNEWGTLDKVLKRLGY